MTTLINRSYKRKVWQTAMVLAALAAWVSIPFVTGRVSADVLSDTRIGATLTGPAIGNVTPAGFAEHRLDDDGRRRLRVEGSSINLASGTPLEISVNGALFGQTTVSQF